MTVKIDPGAQVNTIPLSRYQKLFSQKSMGAGTPNIAPLAVHPIPGTPMMSHQNPVWAICSQGLPYNNTQVIPHMLLCVWGCHFPPDPMLLCYIREDRDWGIQSPNISDTLLHRHHHCPCIPCPRCLEGGCQTCHLSWAPHWHGPATPNQPLPRQLEEDCLPQGRLQWPSKVNS